MSTVVHDGQCLSSDVRIVIDFFLAPKKDLLGVAQGEICLFKDVIVAIKAVLCYLLSKDLHVLFDFE